MVVMPMLFAVQTGGDKRRPSLWAPIIGVLAVTALAVALFAASFFRGRERDLAEELAAARERLRGQAVQLTTFTEAFAILREPETVVAPFAQGHLQGRVFVNPSEGVVLITSGLPLAPAGKTYEMWLLPKRGMPVAAGLFQPAMDGSALHVRRESVDLGGIGAAAVTLEDAAGVPQPTSQPLIVVRLDATEPRPPVSRRP
jgi:anti-sigma-K factor RskA